MFYLFVAYEDYDGEMKMDRIPVGRFRIGDSVVIAGDPMSDDVPWSYLGITGVVTSWAGSQALVRWDGGVKVWERWHEVNTLTLAKAEGNYNMNIEE